MKKLISCILLACMLLPAAAISIPAAPTQTITTTLTFTTPSIQTSEDQTTIAISNTNSLLHNPGAPTLPSQLLTYTFPLGTTINAVTVTSATPQQIHLTADLTVSAAPHSAADDGTMITAPIEPVNLQAYPTTPYTTSMGGGIKDEQHVLYLNIHYTPVQYHQATQTLTYYPSATVSIDYTLPTRSMFPTTTTYKLVIIAPTKFDAALQPLIAEKNAHNITTKLIAPETICNMSNYSAGRDCAEKMKLFIKDAAEHWGTTYVMLVGGRSGGIMKEKWFVPVRYTNLDDNSGWEGGYLSDLYFADLYNANSSFSSWDTNGNGKFAEWNSHGKDILDMYPDIYLGRLGCINAKEVTTVVNKIIAYETTTQFDVWFKNFTVAGGDSYPGDQWYEGEAENAVAMSYMNGFDATPLWTSNGNLTMPADVIGTINMGCGFFYCDGHGNPMVWATHPPNNESWVNGLLYQNMPRFINHEMLPIVVCGGCHNGQFNVSIGNFFKGLIQQGKNYFHPKFWYREWPPECWAWKFISVPRGGSIATMANTALDYFATGDYNNDSIPDAVQFYSGYMNTQFFHSYGVDNITVLGQTYEHGVTSYLNAFPPMSDQTDCKTVQEFTLFGDPTLAIGGYQ
jgi:hypothetical protein